MTPEEKVTEIVEFIYTGDSSDYEEFHSKIKSMLYSAFTDGILAVHEDSAMLDHPDCPDFEDWYKGEI